MTNLVAVEDVPALPADAPDGRPRGFVARYARGADYHDVMWKKLGELTERISVLAGRPVASRICVDTAPLLEREVAANAGLGFIGKSTMLIVPGLGTCTVLGEILLDVSWGDATHCAPSKARTCGRCRLCLDACPTGALVAPYVLDARRCISYLTIESRGTIPEELARLVGNRIFGCDVCQEVCPYNAAQKERPCAPELAPDPGRVAPLLEELLHEGSAAHRRRVRGTALRRTSRAQLARNARVALGNLRAIYCVHSTSTGA